MSLSDEINNLKKTIELLSHKISLLENEEEKKKQVRNLVEQEINLKAGSYLLFNKMKIVSDDVYFKVIKNKVPVYVHIFSQNKHKLKKVGYFAGVEAMSNKILVCRNLEYDERNKQVILYKVKRLNFTTQFLCTDLYDNEGNPTDAIILSPLAKEYYTSYDRAEYEMMLFNYKIELKNLKEEFKKYKNKFEYTYNYLEDLIEQFHKIDTKCTRFEIERHNLYAKIYDLSLQLQANKTLLNNTIKFISKYNSVLGEDLSYFIDELMKKIDELQQALMQPMTNTVEDLITSAKHNLHKLSALKSSDMEEKLNELEQKLNRIQENMYKTKQEQVKKQEQKEKKEESS